MNTNKLKLNPDKTEFILIGTKLQRSKLEGFFPTSIMDENLIPSDNVKNLGVIFDSDFSFTKHVSAVAKSCYYHIRDLSRIRRHLSRSTAISLANALVSSRLDYCNSLFYSLSQKQQKRLQNIQNTLCRVITRTSRFSSISHHMKSLHWLPVRSRVLFKLGLLIFKSIHNGIPNYLKQYLKPYFSARVTNQALKS